MAESITGTQLLNNEVHWVQKYGSRIIHQNWQSQLLRGPTCTKEEQGSTLPSRYIGNVGGWVAHHPGYLHVLWSGSSNAQLVAQHYPAFSDMFFSLPTIIQQVDTARLLYLHRFGGLYADVDYVCHANVFEAAENFSSGASIALVESPYLLSEITQNSLMLAREPGQPFFVAAVQNIQKIRAYLDSQTTGEYSFFNNFWLKFLMEQLYTAEITGPILLDKTILQQLLVDCSGTPSVCVLPYESFSAGNTSTTARGSTSGGKLLRNC
jgi:hypothetical protein